MTFNHHKLGKHARKIFRLSLQRQGNTNYIPRELWIWCVTFMSPLFYETIYQENLSINLWQKKKKTQKHDNIKNTTHYQASYSDRCSLGDHIDIDWVFEFSRHPVCKARETSWIIRCSIFQFHNFVKTILLQHRKTCQKNNITLNCLQCKIEHTPTHAIHFPWQQ